MKTLSMLVVLFALPFAVSAAPTEVTCESQGGRQADCEMDTGGVVVVKRQLSHTQCIEGQNWGLSKHSVWVKDGCRAVFARQDDDQDDYQPPVSTAGASDSEFNSHGRAPAAAFDGCNEYSGQDRDGEVVSQNAMKPGWWEIILRWDSTRYVCNVSSGGKVDSFEELH